MIKYSDVEAKPLCWLLPNIFPIDLSLLVSAPGSGKGTLMNKIMADVTQGRAVFNGLQMPAGTVITISPEDDPETCTVHRLTASDAILSRVTDFTTCGEDNHPFTIGTSMEDDKKGRHDDVGLLEAKIIEINADPYQPNVRLIVIDPLNQVAGCKLTINQTVRNKIMVPLRNLAKRYNIAVVLVHHFNKSGSVAGSAAVVEAARHVLEVHRDGGRRKLRIRKSNIADDQGLGFDYYIRGASPANTVQIAGSDAPLNPEQRIRAQEAYDNLRSIIGR